MTSSATDRLAALLEPFAAFDQLHASAVRAHGHRLIDLSFPNPQHHASPEPTDTMARLAAELTPAQLGYTPFGGLTTPRRRIAANLSRRHQLRYNFRDLLLTPGATAAAQLVLQTQFQPGDEVLLPIPTWMDYPLYLASLGLVALPVPTDPDKRLDIAAIDRAWTPATKGIILTHPSSPTGVCNDPRSVDDLVQYLHTTRPHHRSLPVLISDETHSSQVWGEARLTSPATTYPVSFTIYSFGKAWQMQGQRVGYIAVNPNHPERDRVRTQLATALRTTGIYGPTTLMQHLAGRLADFAPDTTSLQHAQRTAREALTEAGFAVVAAEATPFVYARSPLPDDRRFAERAAQHGVLIMPSTLFGESGYFRISLNTPDDRLLAGIEALAATEPDDTPT